MNAQIEVSIFKDIGAMGLVVRKILINIANKILQKC